MFERFENRRPWINLLSTFYLLESRLQAIEARLEAVKWQSEIIDIADLCKECFVGSVLLLVFSAEK